MIECGKGFWGGRQRATSTTVVQGDGWGYGVGGFKFWWEGMACETSRNKKSDGRERRETQTLTKKKKRSDTGKKRKKK